MVTMEGDLTVFVESSTTLLGMGKSSMDRNNTSFESESSSVRLDARPALSFPAAAGWMV